MTKMSYIEINRSGRSDVTYLSKANTVVCDIKCAQWSVWQSKMLSSPSLDKWVVQGLTYVEI